MIDAILENRPIEKWSARRPRSVLYEILALLALTVGPFFLLGPIAGPLVATFPLLILILIVPIGLRYDNGLKQPMKIAALSNLFGLAFAMIQYALIIIAVATWAWWAFESGDSAKIVIGVTVAATVPFALFIAFAPRLARNNGGLASCYLQGIREQGFGHYHRAFFSNAVYTFGASIFFAYIILAAFLAGAARREVEGIDTSWDLVVAHPILLLSLLIAATMLPAGRNLFYTRMESAAAVSAYTDGTSSGLELDERSKTVLGLLSAGTLVVSVIIATQMLSTVQFTGSYGKTTRKAVDVWVAAQREEGRTTAEIAARLNRFGTWTPDAPEAGLATLIEQPETVFANGCSVATTAGVANLSGHRAIAWLPDQQAASDLRYCLRMTCPVAGQTEPMLAFVSSHGTRNRSWKRNRFVDYYRQGEARAPGGYCTANGRLADDFQG